MPARRCYRLNRPRFRPKKKLTKADSHLCAPQGFERGETLSRGMTLTLEKIRRFEMRGPARTKLLRLTSLIVCMSLSLAALARADVVSDWNAIAAQTAIPVRPGPSAILDLAMVHAAMHDAIQAFQGRFESYGAPIPNASGSPVAAAAKAAHDVLVERFPSQSASLDTLLDNYLIGLGLQGDTGLIVGQQAAANILNLRAGDGSFPATSEVFTGGTGAGEWRPTPPAFA